MSSGQNAPSTPFAVALTVALRQRGLTQRDLASRVGVSSNTVSSWTRGEHTPSSSHARAVAEQLGEDVGSLLGGPAPRARPAPPGPSDAEDVIARLGALRLSRALAPVADSVPDLIQVLRDAEKLADDLRRRA